MTAEFTLAIHALVYLQQRGSITSSTMLAEDINTNPARVRMVMSKLHHAGIIDSTQGQHSGYRANDATENTTLAELLEALHEQPLEMHWRSGDEDHPSPVAIGLMNSLPPIYDELNAQCIQHLGTITIGDIYNQIFTK